MYNEILTLEKRFFQHKYISDRTWLEKILHGDFLECGKSGKLFDKKYTVESLLKCAKNRDIEINDYTCRQIDKNSWLIHYITVSENNRYFRTSVWVLKENLQLLYHQATILKE